jgi:superoxide dismutase, Cu-Zn family
MKTQRFVGCVVVLVAAMAACNRENRRAEPEPSRQESPPSPGAAAPPAPNEETARRATGDGAATVAKETLPAAHEKREAEAEFKTAKATKLEGNAKFQEVANGVKVVVEVEDAPVGSKGIHIHEKGDCSNIEGESMGKHYAPRGEPHGLPGAAQRHLGDLGNIQIDKDGKGRLEITAPGANLKPNDPMSFLGRAIVIHMSTDTGTQPSGGSGKPIACAVIEAD